MRPSPISRSSVTIRTLARSSVCSMTARSSSVVHRLPFGETAHSTTAVARRRRVATQAPARCAREPGRGSFGSAFGPTCAGRSSTHASITSPATWSRRRSYPPGPARGGPPEIAGQGPSGGRGPASQCVVPAAGAPVVSRSLTAARPRATADGRVPPPGAVPPTGASPAGARCRVADAIAAARSPAAPRNAGS